MEYSPFGNGRYNGHITEILKSSQGDFLEISNENQKDSFGRRLRILFGKEKGTEVVEELEALGIKSSSSSMTGYDRDKSHPKGADLIKIAKKLKCNLHWLLTGEGEPGGVLAGTEKEIVEALAKRENVTVSQLINTLVREALAARGSTLFANIDTMTERERQELMILFRLYVEMRGGGGGAPKRGNNNEASHSEEGEMSTPLKRAER